MSESLPNRVRLDQNTINFYGTFSGLRSVSQNILKSDITNSRICPISDSVSQCMLKSNLILKKSRINLSHFGPIYPDLWPGVTARICRHNTSVTTVVCLTFAYRASHYVALCSALHYKCLHGPQLLNRNTLSFANGVDASNKYFGPHFCLQTFCQMSLFCFCFRERYTRQGKERSPDT